LPIYAGTIVAGHVAGRTKAASVSENTNAPEWSSADDLAADADRSQDAETARAPADGLRR
jgi:hypothetical protein